MEIIGAKIQLLELSQVLFLTFAAWKKIILNNLESKRYF